MSLNHRLYQKTCEASWKYLIDYYNLKILSIPKYSLPPFLL
nr:MAG TPA: hypothetical protein [Bacteriophage sp.]